MLTARAQTDVDSSSSSVHVDDDAFPVVVVRFAGAPVHADFARFLDAAAGLLDRKQFFVTVIDAREGHMLPFALIKDAGDWLKREGPRRKVYSRGTALVFESPVQRAVFSAVLRLSPMGDPYAVFSDVESAAAWALGVLRRPMPMGD